MNENYYIVGILVAALLALGGYVLYSRMQAPAPVGEQNGKATSTPNTQGGKATNTPTTGVPQTMPVQIALLDTTGQGTGKARGCDTVTMVTRQAPYAAAVLTAALRALFAEPEGMQGGTAYNFIARTSSTLKFDHVTIANGTANIYLTGSLSGLSGVCDDPRAAAQIEETALQFDTVQRVQIYLNGNQTTLIPSQKGN